MRQPTSRPRPLPAARRHPTELARALGFALLFAAGAAPATGQQAAVPDTLPPSERQRIDRRAAFAVEHEAWAAAHDRAIDWLRRHQDTDGGWRSGGDDREGSVTATALATLALMGDGSSLRSGPSRDALRRATTWLRARQDDTGEIGTAAPGAVLDAHALATWALGELVLVSNYLSLRSVADLAGTFVLAGRRPDGTFARDGRADTLQTVLGTLAVLDAPRLELPADLRERTLAIVDAMTAESGRVGWQQKGGPPPTLAGGRAFSPLTETATAAAVLLQLQLGRDPGTHEPLAASIAVLRRAPPLWDEKAGAVDPVYWWLGARAAALAGGECWQVWERALAEQVLPAQRTEGEAAGSWPAFAPWAAELGEAGATAATALALQSAWAQPAGPPAARAPAASGK